MGCLVSVEALQGDAQPNIYNTHSISPPHNFSLLCRSCSITLGPSPIQQRWQPHRHSNTMVSNTSSLVVDSLQFRHQALLATMADMPPELMDNIAQYLSASDLKNLALVQKAMLPFCQGKVHRHLDLTTMRDLRLWLDNGLTQYRQILSHVRTLSCKAKTPPDYYEKDAGNVEKFLKDHLPRFPRLTHLTLYEGPISLGPFSFARTLHVLDLRRCSMSFHGLVTLLNQFHHLVQLTLNEVVDTVDGKPERTPQLSHSPKNLSISHVSPRGEVVSEFSGLGLLCEELSLNITQNHTTAQDFINGSKGCLRSLDLMNTVKSMYRNNLP